MNLLHAKGLCSEHSAQDQKLDREMATSEYPLLQILQVFLFPGQTGLGLHVHLLVQRTLQEHLCQIGILQS